MGAILHSLMVSSHDCKTGMGQMCVISQWRQFGWQLAVAVAVEGTWHRWGRLLGEGWSLTSGSYFGEIDLTVDKNKGVNVGGQGGWGGGDIMVSAKEYEATFSSPVPGSTHF
jgi:hypothetical protein